MPRAAASALALALILAAAAPAMAAETIFSARYTDPTDRYDHGILGDALEWGGIEIVSGVQTGEPGTSLLSRWIKRSWKITLPETLVYEDIAPRLWDVTGDGSPEVVVILTSLSEGASLGILGLKDGKPVELARTSFYGRTHRWLAPIGAADLDGDGRIEIAAVDRPHLARTILLWRYDDAARKLVPVASLPGFTNHRIGWDFIPGGIRDCGQGPEMVVADALWQGVFSVTYRGGSFAARKLGPYKGPDSMKRAMACR